MKPLLSKKIARRPPGAPPPESDWIKAAEQSTVAGCNDFWARQQERMKLAQADRDEATVKVRALRKAGK